MILLGLCFFLFSLVSLIIPSKLCHVASIISQIFLNKVWPSRPLGMTGVGKRIGVVWGVLLLCVFFGVFGQKGIVGHLREWSTELVISSGTLFFLPT